MSAPFSAALAVGARTRVPDRFVRHGCGWWVAVKGPGDEEKALVRKMSFAIATGEEKYTLEVVRFAGMSSLGWKERLNFGFRVGKVRFFASPWRASLFE